MVRSTPGSGDLSYDLSSSIYDASADPFGVHVAVVHWPNEASVRDQMNERGAPRLLLVAPGEDPPTTWHRLEDWVRLPADEEELRLRVATLRRRAWRDLPVVLDDDGLLHRGQAWTAPAPTEAALLRVLLGRPGELVRRTELLSALRRRRLADGEETRPLDTTIRRLRVRVAPFGVQIHTLRGKGYLLEVGDPG